MTDTKNSPQKITVLGLGAMGSRMAGRLIKAGHTVTVWNRTPSAADALVNLGARRAETPREAAADADVVLAMVRDDEASQEVWLGRDGAARGLKPEALAIDSSTLSPAAVRKLAEELSGKAAFVEAPVVGSRPQAEAGQLICLAGGQRDDVERARGVLEAFAGRVSYLGEHGHGALAKLAVNAFFANQVTAAAEAANFLRTAGIEDERWLDLFSNLPVVPAPIAGAMKGMALGQFAPMFPIELVEKDLRYFRETAHRHDAQAPVAETVQGLFASAVAAGNGNDNIHGICKTFQ